MLVQSLVNIWMEEIQRKFNLSTKKSICLDKIVRAIHSKPLFVCFGFEITDFDVAFKKNSRQFSVFQNPITNADLNDAEQEECWHLINYFLISNRHYVYYTYSMMPGLIRETGKMLYNKDVTQFKEDMDRRLYRGKTAKQKKEMLKTKKQIKEANKIIDEPKFKTEDL